MNISKINFNTTRCVNNNLSKEKAKNNFLSEKCYNSFSKEASAGIKAISFCSNFEVDKIEARNTISRVSFLLRETNKELNTKCVDLVSGKKCALNLTDKGIKNLANFILHNPALNYKDQVMDIIYKEFQRGSRHGNNFLEQYDDDYNLRTSFSDQVINGERVITVSEFSNTSKVPTRVSRYVPNKSLTIDVYTYPDVKSTYVYDLTKDDDVALESYSESPIDKKGESNFELAFENGMLKAALFGIKSDKENKPTEIEKVFVFEDNSANISRVYADVKICTNELRFKNYLQYTDFGCIHKNDVHISLDPDCKQGVQFDGIVVIGKNGYKYKANQVKCTDTECVLAGNVYVFKGNEFIRTSDNERIE